VPDFTVAVEEEFALVDPETLGLVNRFEELQQAARGTELEPHLVGELIASEVEIRTGRCDRFEEAAALLRERRAQLRELAEPLGIALAGTGTHPWSRWQDQRIIDTPHYRRNDEILQYVVWRNNSFGLHVHIAIKGPDRAIAVCNALRNFLPELLALSASSPFVDNVNSGLHSARTQIFTRSRAAVSRRLRRLGRHERYVRFLYDTARSTAHAVGGASGRISPSAIEIRISDASPTWPRRAAGRALPRAHGPHRAALDEGDRFRTTRRLLEKNLWRDPLRLGGES
jgi:carboxylate-amine ligase